MGRQQIERLDFADRSRNTPLRMNHEAETSLEAGLYFAFSEKCRRMAASIVQAIANVIRPSDQCFGTYPAGTSSFAPADLRFAWVGVTAGIVGLAALLVLGWNEIGAGQ